MILDPVGASSLLSSHNSENIPILYIHGSNALNSSTAVL